MNLEEENNLEKGKPCHFYWNQTTELPKQAIKEEKQDYEETTNPSGCQKIQVNQAVHIQLLQWNLTAFGGNSFNKSDFK